MKTKKTVLVVDDDMDILKQIDAALRGTYTVVTASSGQECIQHVKKARPDCIVMDVMMHELCEGLETAKALKAAQDTAGIPIIMLTSVNESYDYRSQTDANYFPHDTWLDKPVKPQKLLAEVSRLIG